MNTHQLLHSLGITKCYKGYHHIEYAIQLVIENDMCLQAVTKEVYMVTAAHFRCDWRNVERNIRTAVTRAWHINRPLLCRIAVYHLPAPPSASDFIAIVAEYILRQQATALRR